MDKAAIIRGTINLLVLPQKIKQAPSQKGFSLYFSMDFKKKKPETIKKKSTEMLPPLNLSDRIGKKPWKYATQTEHKNLTSSMRPFLLLLFVILLSKDLIDAAILVYHNLS
jgi:hypothetical protein